MDRRGGRLWLAERDERPGVRDLDDTRVGQQGREALGVTSTPHADEPAAARAEIEATLTAIVSGLLPRP